MKILFAPSETKLEGGDGLPITNHTFALYHDSKQQVLHKYAAFLQHADDEKLQKLFGIKQEKEIIKYKSVNIYHDRTMPAILRYTGVAYDYLDYRSLSKESQHFLDDALIIFSNLFGALQASEMIPNYKLKQTQTLDSFKIEKYYKDNTSSILDDYFKDELIVDLRAGFYNKFYTPNKTYITMKFIKNGKVVSHWAKAYRGKVVRELAIQQPQDEEAFSNIVFQNLHIKEILKKGNNKEFVYEIRDT